MAKYLALFTVALATLVVVDVAQARGRRGHHCHGGSCYVGGYAGGGCANGSCYVGGDYKTATIVEEGPPVVGVAPSAPEVVVSRPPAPRYATSVRRGWFGWRR